jgi:hypothetical protein
MVVADSIPAGAAAADASKELMPNEAIGLRPEGRAPESGRRFLGLERRAGCEAAARGSVAAPPDARRRGRLNRRAPSRSRALQIRGSQEEPSPSHLDHDCIC